MNLSKKHAKLALPIRGALILLALPAIAAGCNYDENRSGLHWFLEMADGHQIEAQEEDYTTLNYTKDGDWMQGMDANAAFGGPGSGIRVPPQGSVPRGQEPYPYGPNDWEGPKSLRNPLPQTEEVLARGQQRYNTYCAVCHGYTGNGDGPVTPRFEGIPSLNSDTIKNWSDGEIFHIVTMGRARMKPYAYQLEVNDRWAVIHYVRLLQAKHTQESAANAAE